MPPVGIERRLAGENAARDSAQRVNNGDAADEQKRQAELEKSKYRRFSNGFQVEICHNCADGCR